MQLTTYPKPMFNTALIVILTFFHALAYCQAVTPEATDKWYGKSDAIVERTDNCGRKVWEVSSTDESPDRQAKKLLSKQIERYISEEGGAYCNGDKTQPLQWQAFPKEKISGDNNPPEIWPGTFEQWISYFNKTQSPNGWDYFERASIIGSNQECKQANQEVIIQRKYKCPVGTRQDYFFGGGCTITPAVCTADVVGRDLGSSGLSTFGHVGITDPQPTDSTSHVNTVYEVLNKKPAIIWKL